MDWMAPAMSRVSSVSFPCPASLVTVILANSVSQETGSDLPCSSHKRIDRIMTLAKSELHYLSSGVFLQKLSRVRHFARHHRVTSSYIQLHLGRVTTPPRSLELWAFWKSASILLVCATSIEGENRGETKCDS